MEAEERIQAAIKTNARSLDLSGLNLYEIPESLGELSNLVELNLFGNQLYRISPEVLALEKLEILKLGCNSISELPPELFDLVNLKELQLKMNNLKALPPEIGKLKGLSLLELVGCGLVELPAEIGNLSILKELYANENYLSDISWIGNLIGLEELSLEQNQIEEIPGSIANLVNLKYGNFCSNYIKQLPPNMSRLKNISELEVDKMPGELPQELSELKDKINFRDSDKFIFKPEDYPQFDNTGAPGSKLEFLMKDLKEYIQKMSDNKNVCITHFSIMWPNSDAPSIFEAMEQNGTVIDPEIKSFYQQCNGIRFRWFWNKHPDLSSARWGTWFTDEPFEMSLVDNESSHIPGYIAIAGVEELFSEDAYMREYLSTFREHENVDLWIFNNNNFFAGQLCFGIALDTKELGFYTGDDHFACIDKADISFAKYIRGIITYNEKSITEE